MIRRNIILFLAVCVFGCKDADAQSRKQHFPGAEWEVVNNPEDLGLRRAALEKAKSYADAELQTAAVMVIIDGKIAYQWGDTDQKFNTHSIRKSVMSALYGKYIRQGLINLDATLGELGIDDVDGLSEQELSATVRDLLKARSGVYHNAHYETEGMKRLKPARYSRAPGTFWYYNNWDFNALNTIFKQQTGLDYYEAIESDFARPIGMQDYTAADGNYFSGPESVHDAYPFNITARDLARFGWLMLNKGNWNGQQIIDSTWVEESVRYHSDATLSGTSGYGYLWWVARDHNKHPHLPTVSLPEGTYAARGAGGHMLMVIPEYNMVFVHRVNTNPGVRNRVPYPEVGRILDIILKGRITN